GPRVGAARCPVRRRALIRILRSHRRRRAACASSRRVAHHGTGIWDARARGGAGARVGWRANRARPGWDSASDRGAPAGIWVTLISEMTVEQKSALASVISIDKEILHGTLCFTGTRVPVQTLIDFLETGESVDDFLAVYPSIAREQVH